MGDKGKRIVVRVSEDSMEAIKAYAEEGKEISLGEAADELITRGLIKPAPVKVEGLPIDADTLSSLTEYAEKKKMTPAEAAKRLITVAIGRLRALETYNEKKK